MTTSTPECPHCGHELTTEEMLAHNGEDLFALAVRGTITEVTCPQCDRDYWVKGGYIPTYTSATNEDEL